MANELGVCFPSEAQALRQQCEAERHLTPHQRLLAAADVLAAAEALSRAGGKWEAQLQYQQSLELDWQRRMKEFIQAHV